MSIKVLHICNNLIYSELYKDLYQELDKLNISQTIFHPLRKKLNKDENIFELKNGIFIYSKILKIYHRLFFSRKVNYLYASLMQQVDVCSFNLLHATTLFSDGALAYKIYKKYNIPYIVTVRATDVHMFLKYKPDLYLLGLKIIKNAQKIIFITPALKSSFFNNLFFRKHQNLLKNKIEVIPNGINNFWHKNIFKLANNSTNKFLFIGNFNSNKNILKLIKALSETRKTFNDITLTLVGGFGNKHKKIVAIAESNNWIDYVGKVTDKQKLLDIYRNHDFFAMPSLNETFGLVYIEALSQNLPILYTANQGVDGIFNERVGVACLNPKSKNEIVKNVNELIKNKKIYADNIAKIDFNEFLWSIIAKKYLSIYETILH